MCASEGEGTGGRTRARLYSRTACGRVSAAAAGPSTHDGVRRVGCACAFLERPRTRMREGGGGYACRVAVKGTRCEMACVRKGINP